MKAAVCERYGAPEVVVIQDVPVPAVGDGDVLIRVNVASLTIADARIRALRVPRGLSLPTRLAMGITGPRHPILGLEVAGVVAQVGAAVRSFKAGDRVIATRKFKFGGHAEFITVPESGTIVPIPGGVPDATAVAVLFGGITALIFFDEAKLQAGQHILINGASGAVGVMAVQIAKLRGATITGVCSAANADLVRSLGADHVIDYTSHDFTQDSARYDVIMDNVGNAPYARVRQLLKPGGRLLMVIGDLPQMLAAMRQKDVISASKEDAASSVGNYRLLMEMLAAEKIRAVIDRSLALEDIVEGYRLVDSGRKRGSVVITVGTSG